MRLYNGQGQLLTFSSPEAERAWARGQQSRSTEPLAASRPTVPKIPVEMLIEAAERQIGSRLLTDDETEYFLDYALRENLSRKRVMAEIAALFVHQVG